VGYMKSAMFTQVILHQPFQEIPARAAGNGGYANDYGVTGDSFFAGQMSGSISYIGGLLNGKAE